MAVDQRPARAARPGCGAKVIHPRQTDHVLLKALPVGQADALLARPDGCPAFRAQTVDDGGGGQETVTLRNLRVRVARKDARRECAELVIVDLVVAC